MAFGGCVGRLGRAALRRAASRLRRVGLLAVMTMMAFFWHRMSEPAGRRSRAILRLRGTPRLRRAASRLRPVGLLAVMTMMAFFLAPHLAVGASQHWKADARVPFGGCVGRLGRAAPRLPGVGLFAVMTMIARDKKGRGPVHESGRAH